MLFSLLVQFYAEQLFQMNQVSVKWLRHDPSPLPSLFILNAPVLYGWLKKLGVVMCSIFNFSNCDCSSFSCVQILAVQILPF